MKKFLIIDGSSMLSTSYYGNLPKSVLFAKTDEEKEKHYAEILRTSKGEYTNALFTMLRTLISLHKKVKPDRSEERRVGKDFNVPCRYRWSPYH